MPSVSRCVKTLKIAPACFVAAGFILPCAQEADAQPRPGTRLANTFGGLKVFFWGWRGSLEKRALGDAGCGERARHPGSPRQPCTGAMGSEMTDREIFLNAPSGASREELDVYLDRVCRDDPALRARVESLFAADEEAGTLFLNGGPSPALLAPDRVGERMGGYKLIQRIGEIGPCEVYMAQRERPQRRCVALKLIKAGDVSEHAIERFGAERKALAKLDHPNIAGFLEAGVTGSGLPFFAIELVRGIPITQFCEDHGLDIRQRIGLFGEIVSAVQYAHELDVVHGSLTPSRVLVGFEGDTRFAKILGFGADATSPADAAMAQSDPSTSDDDRRADICALGVILRALLVETAPAEKNRPTPPDLDDIVNTALGIHPARRYQLAGDLLADLQQFLSQPTRAVSLFGRAWERVTSLWRGRRGSYGNPDEEG